MQTIIDLSHHNTIPDDFQLAAESGVVGVIHKATEGTSFVDSELAARYHLALEAGLFWGVYHFLTESDPLAQARHFVDTIKDLDVFTDDTLVACDHEDTDATLKLLRQFLLETARLTQRRPVLYSGHILKEQLADYVGPDIPLRLWLAQYGPEAELPPGFSNWWLWQYTDAGQVPGIDPPVDLNHYASTRHNLEIEWAGTRVMDGDIVAPRLRQHP